MRGYLTVEEEMRLADIFVNGPQPVTPKSYVEEFTEPHMLGLVYANSTKLVRLTRKGRQVAKALCKEHGYG